MLSDVPNRHQAASANDGTGIGNVVNDLTGERAHKFAMTGRARTQLLVECVTAVQRGAYPLPANTPAFAAHKGTTVEEVDAPGRWNSQLSDDVAAFALAHNAADRQAPPAAGEGVPRTAYVEVAARARLRPGRTSAPCGGGGADGRGGDELVCHQLTPCSMVGVRRWCTSTRLVRVRPRSDVDGTQQRRDASDRLHADCCCARDVRRWDWFVEV